MKKINISPSDITQTFIIEPLSITGQTIISACTSVYTDEIISCDGDATIILGTGSTIFNTSLIPTVDTNIDLGSQIKRFRNINTVSGNSTFWTASTSVTTTTLNLGLDNNNELRQITANNSIINNDTVFGGTF